MTDILLYLSSGLIIIPFICYGIFIIINSKKKVSNDNGFDISKKIISEYDSINIIEDTGNITYYNCKRGVIRLNSKCYYGNDLGRISISLLESGISVVDKHNNKYLNIIKIVFANIKALYLFPIIALIINNVTYTTSDAKVGMIILLICTIITYMYIDIITESLNWINDNIKKVKSISKENSLLIINYINKIINLNKLIFIGELIIIIRLVGIIINFKI